MDNPSFYLCIPSLGKSNWTEDLTLPVKENAFSLWVFLPVRILNEIWDYK